MQIATIISSEYFLLRSLESEFIRFDTHTHTYTRAYARKQKIDERTENYCTTQKQSTQWLHMLEPLKCLSCWLAKYERKKIGGHHNHKIMK